MPEIVAIVGLLVVIVLLVRDRRTMQREHAAQVASLCQRLQAPAMAVVAHDRGGDVAMPQPPAFDDDEAHWLSKDELADRL